MPSLIDSDVLIDISQAPRAYIDALPERWAIPQVSALELIVGARDQRELANIDAFLSAYETVPLRQSIGERPYELLKLYAKPHGLHVFGSLIAAIEDGFSPRIANTSRRSTV
jgi:predicted nucleic acid-binding protein